MIGTAAAYMSESHVTHVALVPLKGGWLQSQPRSGEPIVP